MDPLTIETVGGRHDQKSCIRYVFDDLTMRVDRRRQDGTRGDDGQLRSVTRRDEPVTALNGLSRKLWREFAFLLLDWSRCQAKVDRSAELILQVIEAPSQHLGKLVDVRRFEHGQRRLPHANQG